MGPVGTRRRPPVCAARRCQELRTKSPALPGRPLCCDHICFRPACGRTCSLVTSPPSPVGTEEKSRPPPNSAYPYRRELDIDHQTDPMPTCRVDEHQRQETPVMMSDSPHTSAPMAMRGRALVLKNTGPEAVLTVHAPPPSAAAATARRKPDQFTITEQNYRCVPGPARFRLTALYCRNSAVPYAEAGRAGGPSLAHGFQRRSTSG